MARLPYPPFTLKTSARPPINVIKLLSHSPSTVEHWTAVGTAHYRALLLPKKLREITMLYCAAKFQSSYEWEHHVIVSASVLNDAQRELIKRAAGEKGFWERRRKEGDKEVEGLFDLRERLLLRFLETTTDGPSVEDRLWEEVRGVFGEREVVEVLSLQGFYYFISRLGTVLQVDMDQFALDWEKDQKAKAKL